MRKLLAGLVAAIFTVVGIQSAAALPVAPVPAPPIAGIPAPCTTTNPWPEDTPIAKVKKQFEEAFGIKIIGGQWTEEFRSSIKIVWETFDAVSCTDYVKSLLAKNNGNVGINADKTRSWAWGDWSLTKNAHVTLDFRKFKIALDNRDEGRLVRLVIHEFAHAFNSDRYENPKYWQEFQALQKRKGRFSRYAQDSLTETFADTVGYYVGRCALDNPYDSGEHNEYYNFVKENVFHGREFGPKPGVKPDCRLPKNGAVEPAPALNEADGVANRAWFEDLLAE